jgi:hypothetical protein
VFKFNQLLKNVGIDPRDVYVVRHKDTRAAPREARYGGTSPYSLWATQLSQFELYQKIQSKECFRGRNWIASFVVTPDGRTLFAGLYRNHGLTRFPERVQKCPSTGKAVGSERDYFYDLDPSDLLKDGAGKITVDWGKGFRSFIQKADSRKSGDKTILEMASSVHELPFPGYRTFQYDLNKIRLIPLSWQQQLRRCQGIYLLTCKDHGKQYVGKADGLDGFWGRFCKYADNGHGGNRGMKIHKTSGYIVSILEALATSVPEELNQLETTWKNKLGTRRWGLNKN